MDPILAGMRISLAQYWQGEIITKTQPPSNVIDFATAAERQRQKRAAAWLRNWTRPMPPFRGDAA